MTACNLCRHPIQESVMVISAVVQKLRRKTMCPALMPGLTTIVLMLLTLMPVTPAFTATVTTTFNVTATVSADCSVTATDLNFGTYNPMSLSDLDALSTITVQCTLLVPYNVRLNKGLYGENVADRKMKHSTEADQLNYALYRDASRMENWGETDGVDTVDGIGTGLPVYHTVYGRVPAGQNVRTGTYSDTITVTVNY